jgi:hypothetical protein
MEGLRYFWQFPSLQEARDQWDALYGKEEWPEDIAQAVLPITNKTRSEPF